MSSNYTEENIRSLDWKEHIRFRPGMYIGKLGDGSSHDDGIYLLLKEVIDNGIDEFVMGHGKIIDISIKETTVVVRDYGRGIPLGKVLECVSRINTGAKYDTKAFKKSVGLNGVGSKAVNALSSNFKVESIRDDKVKEIEFEKGEVVRDARVKQSDKREGTKITFQPDEAMFGNFKFFNEHVEQMLWNYVHLNPGLIINLNGRKFISKNGLLDLLNSKLSGSILYPIIHLKGEDIEVTITHGNTYGEEYYSFVNGQHTTQGGTHNAAFRVAIVKTIRDFFKKDYDAVDIRSSIIAAISIKVIEPVFESQTKTKLGSLEVEPGGKSMGAFVQDFLTTELDNYLHKNPETAEAIQKKIMFVETERKEFAGYRRVYFLRDQEKIAEKR